MSVRVALRFIERLTRDPDLAARLAVLPRDGLGAVTRLAANHGFHFDEPELRQAFLIDWKMRRRYYGAADAPVRGAKLRGPKPK